MLSACNATKSSHDMFKLCRGFVEAGAGSVLISMWSLVGCIHVMPCALCLGNAVGVYVICVRKGWAALFERVEKWNR